MSCKESRYNAMAGLRNVFLMYVCGVCVHVYDCAYIYMCLYMHTCKPVSASGDGVSAWKLYSSMHPSHTSHHLHAHTAASYTCILHTITAM